MTRITPIARIVLGLIFVLFSANYFFGPFLPMPKDVPPGAAEFAGVLVTSHFMTFIKAIELGSGLLLLANRFPTLAMALLAPIIVGITLFHALLEPAGLPVAGLALALEVFLAWSYRDAFRPMLRARVAPTAAAATHAAPAAQPARA